MPARRHGATLMEAMMTMALGALGIVGVMALLLSSAALVRRGNTEAQALMLAQRELEDIASRGCTQVPIPNCNNVLALDDTVSTVWASTTSGLVTVAPVPTDPVRRAFRLAIDADAPGFFEGWETGSPALNRPLDAMGNAGIIVNVRVTVSWEQPLGVQRAVALQTRVSP